MQPAVVRVHDDAYRVLSVEARLSRDGLETGGICLGSKPEGSTDTFEVTVAGTPGPGALRTPALFERDLDHARLLEDNAHRRDGSVWIGEWHTHPRGPRKPSSVDVKTYNRLLADPQLAFDDIVSIVVTKHWYFGWDAPQPRAWIVRVGSMTPARVIRVAPTERISSQ